MRSKNTYRWHAFSVLLAVLVWQTSAYATGPYEETVSQPKGDYDFREVETVDPSSGSLVIKHLDVSLPGPSDLGIKVYRTYNTSAVSASLNQSYRQSFNWIALGPGWRLRAAPRLVHGNNFILNSLVTPEKQIYSKSPLGGDLCTGAAVSAYSPLGLFLELPDGSQQQVFSSGGGSGRTPHNSEVSVATCW
ncbi:DUF6531 domain-containing protein [Pseudomonas sp. Marseille-Q5299]|uniref:DUF6531 domain-containing protein n=1 Tax=Pseudomonas sp. Marseille-Q5299 TaxID=2942201 RepID=UPI00336535F9